MRVEELAAAHSVSVDTVRYYQRIGLLPSPERHGRVASYGEHHERRLGEIRRLSGAGFSLAQIRRLCDGNDDPMLAALGARETDTLTFDELVRQSGLGEELVRLAADTGLVRPRRASTNLHDHPSAAEDSTVDALYSAGALTMLRAAMDLLAADIPLDDLIGLALRHASNMDAVAADAVGLFADRFADMPTAQRADLAARLIPLVTDLVAQHFRESLVEHATERILASDELTVSELTPLERAVDESANDQHDDAGSAGRASGGAETASPTSTNTTTVDLSDSGAAPAGLDGACVREPGCDTGRVTLECRELRDAPDPLAVFAAAQDMQRVYWASPDDELEFCALGSAFEANAVAGEQRWASVAETLERLDVSVTGGNGHPTGPLLVGGFSFSPEPPATGSTWASFGAGRLTLPEVLLVRRGERSWLTATTRAALGPVMAAARSAAMAADTATSDPNATALALLRAKYQADDGYESLVRCALDRIGGGGMDKVVTARALRISSPLEPVAVLDRLRRRYPSCVTFAFGRGPQTFLGATPERLVSFDGNRLRTDALAGSRPRCGDIARDRELAAELRRDPKELTEHAMVVTDVRDTLRRCGITLDPPAPSGVMELQSIMHLHTPIAGRLAARSTVLELAGALHPTAAVAGLPRRIARRWIERHEDFERGWYAAPIGWTTLDGHGEFRVALRCALTGPHETRLFAGGGIVADADPRRELAETATKFEALMHALEDD
ncbi:isochorismate synthase [Candidatus Poriferisodalis sp.]|uniref:isochorismate synthase n=1 Tax=Candidatus Poriferisodalis sp. TaxID=3101277 RepID=UPI003B013FDD